MQAVRQEHLRSRAVTKSTPAACLCCTCCMLASVLWSGVRSIVLLPRCGVAGGAACMRISTVSNICTWRLTWKWMPAGGEKPVQRPMTARKTTASQYKPSKTHEAMVLRCV